jgi:prophage endopeptidase
MNPYVVLALLVAWLGSVGATAWWQNDAGHTAERALWQAREAAELAQANTRIVELEELARVREWLVARKLETISAQYEKEKADAQSKKLRDIAAAHAGTLSLRIASPCQDPARGEAAPAGAGAAGRDGPPTDELPRALAAGLFALADEADEVVLQLTACQAIVRADRAPAQ